MRPTEKNAERQVILLPRVPIRKHGDGRGLLIERWALSPSVSSKDEFHLLPGWGIRKIPINASSRRMAQGIYDQEGSLRGIIYPDPRSFLAVKPRFLVLLQPRLKGAPIPPEQFWCQVLDRRKGERTIWYSKTLEGPASIRHWRTQEFRAKQKGLLMSAWDWLSQRYPNWPDPFAYWQD